MPPGGLDLEASTGEAQLPMLEREGPMWGSGVLSPPGMWGL